MTDYRDKFENELNSLFDYINAKLLTKYPCDTITSEHFLLSVLECENCTAHKTISKLMFSYTISMLKEWYNKYFLETSKNSKTNEKTEFDSGFETIIVNTIEKNEPSKINSAYLLSAVLDNDERIKKTFKLFSITSDELKNCVPSDNGDMENNNTEWQNKTIRKNVENGKSDKTSQSHSLIKHDKKMNDVEKNLVNLNNLAINGKINDVIGNDDIIKKIFIIWKKKYKNNVALVGDPGVGKTATVMHIANLLAKGEVPDEFKGKKLMKMNFSRLLMNTITRGSLESKLDSIISVAKSCGEYIFFIDDIQTILSDKRNFGDFDIIEMLDIILLEKNIQFICTTTWQAYRKYIDNEPSLRRKLQNVELTQPDYNKNVKILNHIKERIEKYHDVTFNEDTISQCVRLCERYMPNYALPDIAIDILDEAGAASGINTIEIPEINEINQKINETIQEKDELDKLPYKNYEKYDSLTKKEIALKSKLKSIKKEYLLKKEPTLLTTHDIKTIISKRSDIPIDEINKEEKERLKNLDKNIKKYVVGQDEAVDEVCKTIKKQKIGISNPSKPPVFLFTGPTGTGKTYLAKKIAEEIYGNEKYLVRLDMSEYSDKMSVNKLYGSANGYIGYENGGQLTEAIKKKKYCVLLLDEIEKANEDVHNVFLQLFDEGRLTDNTGYTVDFKNVIIIMTSNVGTKEINEKWKPIGLIKNNSQDLERDIISKAIKKKFKPEFINRINKIIYFNSLNEYNLKKIIKLEIQKLEKRINNSGYYFDKNFIDDDLVNEIYNKIDNFEYGAREINRKIETELEDKIINYIISNDIETNHLFTKKELKI